APARREHSTIRLGGLTMIRIFPRALPNATRPRGRQLRPAVEQLEERTVLSSGASLRGGTLLIQGTAASDHVQVSERAGKVVVSFDGHTSSFRSSAVHQIRFSGGN